MHGEVKHFTEYVKSQFPEFFNNYKIVLDVGAADINGNNTHLFSNCVYLSNDVVSSRNVTIVSETHNLPFTDASFDTIISTECFEHDMNYKKSFKKIMKLLKPGGLFTFTCATTGRHEHGTLRTNPTDSMTCFYENVPEWANYYKNLTSDDIIEAFGDDNMDQFFNYEFYTNDKSHDLYFWGIKKPSECKVTEKYIPA
jgi:cyclopropane fatty-acyl-phospholipid synthase-like methyltransferase